MVELGKFFQNIIENDTSAKYVVSALGFKALEEMCNKFVEHIGQSDDL